MAATPWWPSKFSFTRRQMGNFSSWLLPPKMPSTYIILEGSFFSQGRWIHIFTKYWIAKSLFILNIIGLFLHWCRADRMSQEIPFFAEFSFLSGKNVKTTARRMWEALLYIPTLHYLGKAVQLCSPLLGKKDIVHFLTTLSNVKVLASSGDHISYLRWAAAGGRNN